MPPFDTAHTFCVSCDGPRKLGFLTAVPVKTEIFFVADLGKDYWNLKRKLKVKNLFDF